MSEIKNKKVYFLFTVFIIFVLILIGTVTVHLLEGWSWIDSLYWAVMNITTVGDSTKMLSDSTKLFAVVYVLFGVAIVLYSMLQIAAMIFKINEETAEVILRKGKKLPERLLTKTEKTLKKVKYKMK